MKVRPIKNYLLVRLVEAEEVTAGGIVIATQTHEKETAGSRVGTVLAMGPECFERESVDPGVSVGSTIVFDRYAGGTGLFAPGVTDDVAELHKLMADDEVKGVIDEEHGAELR